MIVTLYTINKLYKFKLPEELSGSYSFQDDSGNKIVNIEVRNNKWVLYSTRESLVRCGKNIADFIEIKSDEVYFVEFKGKLYPIYVTTPNSFSIYKYSNNSNLTIGFNGALKYNTQLTSTYDLNIVFSDNIVLNNLNRKIVYINGNACANESVNLKSGTIIDIFGLIIIVCKDYLFISNNKRLEINLPETIKPINIGKPDKILTDEIKVNNLYDENSYFLKSARLYRKNVNKKIEFAAPPSIKENEDLPAILTIAPMLAMGITSGVSLVMLIIDIASGKTTVSNSISQLIIYIVMLISTLLIPVLTQVISKKIRKKKAKISKEKYLQYLNKKELELEEEFNNELQILKENLVSPRDCVEIIKRKNVSFWSKRNDQEDFLDIRIGIGSQPLKAEINFPKEEFSIEESDLRKQAENLIKKYKTIENVPYSFNLYKNLVTGVMGNESEIRGFIDNAILQLITFYSYDDLKIVVFTDDKNASNWEYVKYLPYSFNNTKDVRFFSTNNEDTKNITEFLSNEFEKRSKENDEEKTYKSHYLLIIDGYDNVKRNDFISKLVESNKSLGFSVLIAETRLSKLPSKCSNFIILDGANSAVLKSTYHEPIKFASEVDKTINMLSISKFLANIPVELDSISAGLPDMVSFLEMENVGKVEQLNILNRWNQNDSTQSLKAEIGYGVNEDLMYLDLHEKYHGPHGLIAGMTGSGKSEFIITYILSMCINYSPDDIAFILIDYKGGGLTGAFENIANNIVLPHLAGTITNLDKSEMDRTLVSIESEIQRRQEKFRQAKDKLGESTLDIYKYQRLYKDGKLDEPIPHLFIICDEFAELKSQQPDFMSNLISVARIGRSLGVHLILATQKPSGVVDDQIWSNSKFRVCLKVQDQSDSNEMLKRPEAASLKQTGRYYLQVGYDEYFAIGQSAWCGAKYYPSDDIKINEDRSINFIDNSGKIVRTITDNSEVKQESKGEQITAVIKSIIDVSNKVNKHARKLWLDDVEPIILEDMVTKKYNIQYNPDNIEILIGEYDAPEKQLQGPVMYNFLNDGNTIIYGNDTLELENLLNEMIYTSCKNYSPEQINFYIIDYGSESLKVFNKLPHIGGVVLAGEKEKYSNLFKIIRNELKSRKKLLSDYGGSFERYNKEATKKLPIKVVILDNFSAIYEENDSIYEELPELVADSERYGIVYIITASASNSVVGRTSQFFNNSYVFKLKDPFDATYIFGVRTDKIPRNVFGRGLVNNDGVHEFQTISLTQNKEDETIKINELIDEVKGKYTVSAEKIPTLPDKVNLEEVKSYIKDLSNVPIGISKSELNVETIDFKENMYSVISSSKIDNTKNFVLSLLYELGSIRGLDVTLIDPTESLKPNKKFIENYIIDGFDECIDNIINNLDNNESNGVILIYSLGKLLQKTDLDKFSTLVDAIKGHENYSIIIVEASSKLREYVYETWYSSFNNTCGIWIGSGASDQSIFQVPITNREVMGEYKNDMGFLFYDGNAILCKMIDFLENGDENE